MDDDEYSGSQPMTFPGAGWYAPEIDTGGSAETLPMTAAEKREARERERLRGPFGFGRATDET